MPDGYQYEVSEWWDGEGSYHEGSPSADEMIGEAAQMTVHLTDSDGLDAYYTTFSNIGWTEEDLADDAADAYESGAYE